MHYWEKLRFEIPYIAMDIATHRERYRCLRESVMHVVRDYNANLTSLSPQERRLFTERLHCERARLDPPRPLGLIVQHSLARSLVPRRLRFNGFSVVQHGFSALAPLALIAQKKLHSSRDRHPILATSQIWTARSCPG